MFPRESIKETILLSGYLFTIIIIIIILINWPWTAAATLRKKIRYQLKRYNETQEMHFCNDRSCYDLLHALDIWGMSYAVCSHVPFYFQLMTVWLPATMCCVSTSGFLIGWLDCLLPCALFPLPVSDWMKAASGFCFVCVMSSLLPCALFLLLCPD